ncbi:amidase [Aurantimonas sp. A3-2-R12]|uniref:amidase n=1 Tax=Aurantimonas sp. A3-2-R12 TaxID=3114362 RepID=UPI002E193EA2|nr:amidase [Aurantimonas sp. A3-2-R12]
MSGPVDGQSLREISRQLADGSLRPVALCEATQVRHEPSLNAYKSWAPAYARRQAEAADAAFSAGIHLGALQGIPISVKDLYGVAGLPTFAGSPRELPAAWRREGPMVRRLRGQLAVVTGKTHTVEFAFGGLGTSMHWPVPWNSRDRTVHRAPGGSSSGAGASLVEGTALLAFGTDTGGSVRIPASFTGTVGLKTTWGRWSLDGIVPLSPSLDTPGILTRSVDDAAFAFEALDGETVPDVESLANLRVGIAESFFFDETSPGVAERIDEAIGALEAAGASLGPLALPGCAELFDLYHRGGIVAPELFRFLTCDLPEWLPTLDPRVRARLEAGSALPAWEYLQRKVRYAALGAAAIEALAKVDVLVAPTVPITPPPIADLADDATYARLNMLALRNTCVVSFLGLCALTLPIGSDAAGMPVGLQLIGPPHSEARLLALGRAFERLFAARGIWEPPTHVA